MLCKSPYIQGMQAYGCGQCMPCRVNRRRQWTSRIILEALLKEDNCFITLTYDDKYLTYVGKEGLATLDPNELKGFLKRMREHADRRFGVRIRFFAVGEYGDTTFRPHYHCCLFGWPACKRGRSHFSSQGKCCPTCDVVRTAWGMGNVVVDCLTVQSAAYCAGYVTKKMTKVDDERLQGRHPEFARQSRMPGIGAFAMEKPAAVLKRYGLMNVDGDVPHQFRQAGRLLPLGRYLTRKLREELGKSPDAPQAVLDKQAEELRPMREAALADSKAAPPAVRGEIFKAIFADKINEAYAGKLARVESRARLFKKQRKL